MEFKKGDVVVAKDEFLDDGETLRDTVGVVVSYNPENDYLVLGSIDTVKHSIPQTFSMRGEYYRYVTDKEKEEWGLNKLVKEAFKLYSWDDIQDMISEVNNDEDLKKKVLSRFSGEDLYAVEDVLDDGWYERFERYDSAVCDDFITAWEIAKGIKESVQDIVGKLLEGADVRETLLGV